MESEEDQDGTEDLEGRDLWRFVVRDVKPLQGRELLSEKKQEPKKEKNLRKAPSALDKNHVLFENSAPQGREIDKRLKERMQRGQLPIDARIDLHGLTQDAAKESLIHFILENYQKKSRLVLVITGKGKERGRPEDGIKNNPEQGILKQRVPQWLEEAPLSGIILQYCPAKASHGGTGALYVLLRRHRERNKNL